MMTNDVTIEVAKKGKQKIAEKYNEEFTEEEILGIIDYHYKAMKTLMAAGDNVTVPRLGTFVADEETLKLLVGFDDVVGANAGVAEQ